MSLTDLILQGWDKPNWLTRLLWPLTIVYRGLLGLRALGYRFDFIRAEAIDAPVIVVCNMTVGGTGKTPLVIALVKFFSEQGFRPGVICRGYKSEPDHWPRAVQADSSPNEVGDEAMMIFERCNVPVLIGPERAASAKQLVQQYHCDLVISDDGFAHFGLKRDIDIVVVDGQRRFGNGWCLPAGPLREPLDKIRRAHMVVVNDAPITHDQNASARPRHTIPHPQVFSMSMIMGDARLITTRDAQAEFRPVSDFRGKTVHAIAGIGNPDRFFNQLRHHGFKIIEHPFADHHDFRASDLDFDDDFDIVMTDKDAVKCRSFVQDRNQSHDHRRRVWSIPVDADIVPSFFDALTKTLPIEPQPNQFSQCQ